MTPINTKHWKLLYSQEALGATEKEDVRQRTELSAELIGRLASLSQGWFAASMIKSWSASLELLEL